MPVIDDHGRWPAHCHIFSVAYHCSFTFPCILVMICTNWYLRWIFFIRYWILDIKWFKNIKCDLMRQCFLSWIVLESYYCSRQLQSDTNCIRQRYWENFIRFPIPIQFPYNYLTIPIQFTFLRKQLVLNSIWVCQRKFSF